jgi:muconate cycloisomerase
VSTELRPIVPDIRVSAVDCVLVDVPGRRSHQHASTGMRRQSYLIIRLRTDAGIEGIGEVATAGGPWWSGDSVEAVKATIDSHLAPALVGESATAVLPTMRKLERVAAQNWFAKAGLEMALLDIAGKSVGRPVHVLLGGPSRASVPVTWPLGIGDAAADADEALQRIEAGVSRSFKIKMGALPVEQDVRRMVEIARRLAGRAELRIDLNAAWTEPVAQRQLPALVDAGVVLIEQAIERWNVAGHARLARRVAAPLMADEGLTTLRDAAALSAAGAAQVFALKLMKSGGFMACRDIAAVAVAHGVELFGGCFLESSIGTAANLQLGAALPELAWGSEWIGPLWLADDLACRPIEYRDFAALVPPGPGLGVTLDEDKLRFYRRERPLSVAQPSVRPPHRSTDT